MTWTERAPFPYYYYPVVGGAVVDNQLFAFAINPSFDAGDGGMHALTYDPGTNTWTARPGNFPGPLCCFPMFVAGPANGKVYVFVDDSGSGPMTLEYSPSDDSWSAKAPLPAPNLGGLAYVAASDGKVYAIGASSTYGLSSSVLAFDPQSNSWSPVTSMPSAMVWPSAAATTDGKIYAFDTGVANVYDTTTSSWTTFHTGDIIYNQMGAVQAGDGKIYLVGGPISSSNLGFPEKLVMVYDPKANSWSQQTDLLYGERSPSILALNGNDLYVVSGSNGLDGESRVQEAKIP
jgi:hypothetical protein